MNDNDIIKALEEMTYGGHSCMHCKYGTTKGDYICGLQGCKIGRDALDLINRQKAEIERLNAVSEICGECHKKYAEKIEQAKSEAIKDFAERLKSYFNNGKDVMYLQTIIHYGIDNLVKEMVGDSE